MIENDLEGIDGTSQEDVKNQRIMAQKKEKKIKIIRTLTVIAYLISVSAVATILSAYYIFIWDPQTGNNTQTSHVEGVSMAFRGIAEPERFFTDNGNFISHSLWTKSSSPERTTKLHTSMTTQPSSMQQTINISKSVTVNNGKL